MIKQNKASTRQQLLKKSDDDKISQYVPFELDESFSVVEGAQNDRSYYCLGNDQVPSPYALEMAPMPGSGTGPEPKFAARQISMNGNTYMRVEPASKNAHTADIKALCGACKTEQLIPRDSARFYCFACFTLCRCAPAKEQSGSEQRASEQRAQAQGKVFRCGGCCVKVQYEPGVSQYVRCSKCSTVNMVPR